MEEVEDQEDSLKEIMKEKREKWEGRRLALGKISLQQVDGH